MKGDLIPNIKLRSCDGQIFALDSSIAKCSGVVKKMVTDLASGNHVALPLPGVDSSILKKVMEWASYHQDDPPLEPLSNFEICDWDNAFLDVEQGMLFDIILAAYYLDIKGLYEVACKYLANVIKGKSSQPIHGLFGAVGEPLDMEEPVGLPNMFQVDDDEDSCCDK